MTTHTMQIRSRYLVAACGAALTGSVLIASGVGVSLRASRELTPAGGTAQIKISVTEPKPISSGSSFYEFGDFQFVDGIALSSPDDSAYGVAVRQPNGLAVSVVSPSAAFGTNSDYPVLTVTGRVRPTAKVGQFLPFSIDAGALVFRDPKGAVYPVEVKSGGVDVGVGGSIFVSDVQPGSADVPAGGTVTILGGGFAPDVRVRFDEIRISKTTRVSDSRIDVVVGQAVRMHGLRVRVENKNGPRVTYFAYQRTARAGRAGDPVLDDAVPLFPFAPSVAITVPVEGTVAGVAVQNPGAVTVKAVLQLRDAGGRAVSTKSVTLKPYVYTVRQVTRLFGRVPDDGATIAVTAASPVQAMGIAVDAAGNAAPVLPR